MYCDQYESNVGAVILCIPALCKMTSDQLSAKMTEYPHLGHVFYHSMKIEPDGICQVIVFILFKFLFLMLFDFLKMTKYNVHICTL